MKRIVTNPDQNHWIWGKLNIGWSVIEEKKSSEKNFSILLIHGFGANTNHWRFNQPVLAELAPTYAIDLLGFGHSDQPRARLKDEPLTADSVHYSFDLWGQQVADFCNDVINGPVQLVGNSIGGVVALRAAQLLGDRCHGVVLSTALSA